MTVELFGILSIQMMEKVGQNLTELVRRVTGNSGMGKLVVIAVGKEKEPEAAGC